MPEIPSSFSPPWFLRAARVQTITPSLFRRAPRLAHRQEILELPDGDFLELEWHGEDSTKTAIVTHGLEGSTESGYVRGLIKSLLATGHQVVAWNMRGCGASRNRLPTWYHSGQSEDLRAIVRHALERASGHLSLVGVSIGGNILMKYLGEEGSQASSRIRCAVAVSVPIDLKGSAEVLARPENGLYMRYLLKPLRARMREKKARFPTLFDTTGLSSMRTFHEFDSRYTAPVHGFRSVDHYWESSSSLHYLTAIEIPTLLINALDDPFLSPRCYPMEIARAKDNFYLETPRHGGHVGFIESLSLHTTWLDKRVAQFVNQHS